jgi:hypothetical protein
VSFNRNQWFTVEYSDKLLGFVEYGLEKKALKQDGRFYDEVLMAKDLMAD